MPVVFEGFDYEKAKDKWFKGESLTDEEISGLFGLLDAQESKLNAIREIITTMSTVCND